MATERKPHDDALEVIGPDQPLDPKLKPAADHLMAVLKAAAQRAILHAGDPAAHPIDSKADTAESIFHRRFQSLAKDKQARAIDRVRKMGPPAAVSEVMPDAVKASLASYIGAIAAAHPTVTALSGSMSTDDADAALRVRVRRVKCIDETDPEITDDDMILGGVVTNDKGESVKVSTMSLGEMNDDDAAHQVKKYAPPRWFHTFNLNHLVNGSLKSSHWPKAYLATFVLCETDNGGFPGFIRDLLEVIKNEVAAYVGAAAGTEIGALIGTALFPGLGTLIGAGIGALVGYLLGGIIGWLLGAWEDDEFPPVTLTCKVNHYRPSGHGAFSLSSQWLTASASGGKYEVDVDWQVNWPTTFGNHLDAAVPWDNGKIYFFSGSQYVRYDIAEDRADAGYPKDISAHWPGLWKDGVDAGVMWNNGKAYFFKGDEYVRYDLKADKVDAGYPKKISAGWPGVFHSGIDAVMHLPFVPLAPVVNKAYFFKGDKYTRVDLATKKADPGYPKDISEMWKGVFNQDLDAACYVPELIKAYFFKNEKYIRYNLQADKAEEGYPALTAANWPGL